MVMLRLILKQFLELTMSMWMPYCRKSTHRMRLVMLYLHIHDRTWHFPHQSCTKQNDSFSSECRNTRNAAHQAPRRVRALAAGKLPWLEELAYAWLYQRRVLRSLPRWYRPCSWYIGYVTLKNVKFYYVLCAHQSLLRWYRPCSWISLILNHHNLDFYLVIGR